MFDILEADIVVMQETKIQRKDLQDDMVLVPGWDVYFSLPKHKKGYSGVAIYTRNAVCAPIRAEEGILGVLCPPNSSTPFCELPEEKQIGGYPRPDQLAGIIDADTLDSEGRCVILEFPAFVLIGTYSPAARDDSRDDFRLGYLEALDARVRNLVAMGKRVVLTGDLNVIRTGIDTANIGERLRKEGVSVENFLSTPCRRIFNQMLFEGSVYGEKDESREAPVLWDMGRLFNPSRQGMFTCWDTKKNTRPGNFGSRIDYVLCSDNMKDWATDSNIQEGLMGSDHCPVYVTLADVVKIDGKEVHLRDLLNPEGMFQGGQRMRDWNTKDLLPLSAKLIPDFDKRRSIKDMFSKKPAPKPKVPVVPEKGEGLTTAAGNSEPSPSLMSEGSTPMASQNRPSNSAVSTNLPATQSTASSLKRTQSTAPSSARPQKKAKGALQKEPSLGKAQSSLMGFFKPKSSGTSSTPSDTDNGPKAGMDVDGAQDEPPEATVEGETSLGVASQTKDEDATPPVPAKFIDPIETKESWAKLLGKRVLPKCEHGDDCVSYTTKKPGVNCGKWRSCLVASILGTVPYRRASDRTH